MRTTEQTGAAPHADGPAAAIIVGSTRPGREADTMAHWVHDIAARRKDATYEVVDLRDYTLPHMDEPAPPRTGRHTHTHTHTHAWAQKISSFDAFVFVTPEYNGSIPGALKDAIDFLYAEWNDKAAGFVGYGIQGGVRAVEHLRQISVARRRCVPARYPVASCPWPGIRTATGAQAEQLTQRHRIQPVG
jgi:NAD(P)H-dependent FMN reductase